MSKPYYREPSSNHNDNGIPLKSYYNHGIIPWHWHEEFEFLYVKSGHAICHLENESFPVHEGSLIIICDNSPHTMLPVNGTDLLSLTYDAIVFNPSLFQADREPLLSFFSRPYQLKRQLTLENPIEKPIIELERQLYSVVTQKPFTYEFQLHSLVPRIFNEIFQNGLYDTNNSIPGLKTTPHQLMEVIKYIYTHYTEKITLASLAGIMNYSTPYFSRIFHDITGKTPFEFINYYRIYEASKLLSNTDLSVLEVAISTGFDNLGHFINVFKRYTGTTPLQYRLSLSKLNQEGYPPVKA